MESWSISCAECKTMPSSCVAAIPASPNSISILANGSQFLYFLDPRRKQSLAVLKFSSAVVYVSEVSSLDEMDASIVTCCLASGEVAAFSITTIVKRVRELSEANTSTGSSTSTEEEAIIHLMQTRPKPSRCSRKKTTISAKDVTRDVAICPPLEWVLISAVVLNNNMVMCRKSHMTGDISCVLLKSCRNIEIPSVGRGIITVPSFIRAQQLQSVVSSPLGGVLLEGTRVMDVKPVFSLVQSESHSPRRHNTITSKLFVCLFGLESELSKTPVLLIGCQNGNVYFTNFRSHSDRREDNLMCPLYSLEQPVVGMHTTFFPRNRHPEADDLFLLQEMDEWEVCDDENTHNAVIFLGQGGKIAICHVASDSQPLPCFMEFHVPSPIISSILLPNQFLLYSTMQGLYRVCLRQECADSVEEKLPSLSSTRSIRIPEVSFKFPKKVFDSNCGSYLLHDSIGGEVNPFSMCKSEQEDMSQCLCLTLNGRLSTFQFSPHSAWEKTHKRNSTQVGQEIKHCLRSIQEQGERLDGMMEKIKSFNSVLTELKGVLDILCVVVRSGHGKEKREVNSTPHLFPMSCSRGSPFTCTFKCISEDVGASVERQRVQIELTYHSGGVGEALGAGWSFLATSLSGNLTTSKPIPISGLASGDSISMMVGVDSATCEGEGQLDGYINCFVQYSPHHLYKRLPWRENVAKNPLMFKVASLLLARKEFDILDFLQVRRNTTRLTLASLQLRTVSAILRSDVAGQPSKLSSTSLSPPPLLHFVALSVPLNTAMGTIQTSDSSMTAEELNKLSPKAIASEFLCALVPAAAAARSQQSGGGSSSTFTSRRGGRGAEILTAIDGEGVCIKIEDLPGHGAATRDRPDVTRDRRDGDTRAAGDVMLRLEIRASSRKCLAEVVSAVNKKVKCGALVMAMPAGSAVTESREEVCGRLEVLRQLLEEVGGLQREVSATYLKRRTNCMSVEVFHKALHTWRTKVFSMYCKLRELPCSELL